MKIRNVLILSIFSIATLWSCQKDKFTTGNDLLPTDLLFEEFEIGRFKHEIPAAPFKSKIATFNVQHVGGNWSGFAISNRNYRNFVKKETDVDSTRFSVFTGTMPNAGGNFLVAKTNDDQSYVTFDHPIQVNSVLVANTTQVYQTLSNGQGNVTTGFTFAPGTRALSTVSGESAKVIATGYLNNQKMGEVVFLLADRRSDASRRTFTISDWVPMDLSGLGKIDKLLFQFDTSDKTNGVMNTPAYFCLDGFRFNENI